MRNRLYYYYIFLVSNCYSFVRFFLSSIHSLISGEGFHFSLVVCVIFSFSAIVCCFNKIHIFYVLSLLLSLLFMRCRRWWCAEYVHTENSMITTCKYAFNVIFNHICMWYKRDKKFSISSQWSRLFLTYCVHTIHFIYRRTEVIRMQMGM